ncbi:MAG TPA: hypothetical protein PLB48_13055, partial [Treponema sp.]|nr:hypothetical protein [Treponema sp.]
MKKRVIFTVVLCTVALLASAQTVKSELKFFQGIGNKIAGYDNSLLVPMTDQINYVDTLIGQITGLKLVGQSQGGLRSIAYAGYLKNRGRSANMDTIISIGGPVHGFSPLAQGTGVLKQRINDAANTLYNGWAAVTNLNTSPSGTSEVLSNGGIDEILKMFQLKDEGITAIINSLNNPSGNSVADMTPGSTFLKNNIVEQKVTWTWKRVGFFPFPVANVEKVWKLPTEPKYGFIVGTDSDVLGMVDDYTGGGFDTPIFIGKRQLKVSAKTMKSLYCTATGFAVTAWGAIELYHNVRAGFAWFKFWDHSDYDMHVRYARNAHDWNRKADAGNNWANNYESRFATLLGTGVKENDSFIPSRDQYIDVEKEFGGKYVDRITKGKYTGTTETFNHAE